MLLAASNLKQEIDSMKRLDVLLYSCAKKEVITNLDDLSSQLSPAVSVTIHVG